ncbi:MAG TPA: hypothetical protein VN025_03665 [Candidatus Dormibacteraeota bacterium]|jgi:hypothetical protein|nr:hypothetical protein [Candidatus Dormibacteraeota bacterium]
MNKTLRVILIVLCLEMGAFLLYLPWSNFWEQNYFLGHLPTAVRMFLLHSSFRGIVSGLGVLDILVGISLIQSKAGPSNVPPRPFS